MTSATSCSEPDAEGALAISGGQITSLSLLCFSFLGPPGSALQPAPVKGSVSALWLL